VTQAPPDLVAALADRYTVEREVGRGGMATVYLANDLKHQRRVALKVFRPELAAAVGAERFLREITTTANLRHPHILPLYDSGEAGGFLFYVMPFVEGESLRDRLDREKQLPLDDALQIAREVADALSYAHSHDVVHRDVKPENILLEAGHAVVADFGIARAVSAAGGERLTQTGIAIGTPTYMSPEQAAGSGDLDGRSDLYALGCVLYEMLAGQPPFIAPTAEGLVRQHMTAEAPTVTQLRPKVSGEVAQAIDRVLAKNPADRFATAAAFTKALAVPERVAEPAQRAVVPRGVWAVIAIAVVAMVAVWVLRPVRPRSRSIPHCRPTASSSPSVETWAATASSC
jgi:serine/threonine-protein kinase